MATIDSIIPEGILIDRDWLRRHDIKRTAVDYYLRSGKLESVSRGIYRKSGPRLKWQNIVYSLLQLGYRVHVGHKTALGYHGFHHYLAMGGHEEIKLYGDTTLPGWIHKIDIASSFTKMNRNPFSDPDIGVKDIPFGTWDWPIPYSSPERAFIELVSTVSTSEEIHQACMMMEGAGNLRPGLLQSLLNECGSIKAKRLFLWIARTAGYPWYERIDKSYIDLGKGKRQVVPEGILDDEFQITVPKEESLGQNEPLF